MPKIWLTRTLPDGGSPLAAALQAAGWQVEPLPVLRIVAKHFNADQQRHIRDQLSEADAVLWTSAHAVTVLPAAFFSLPKVPQVFAVGGRTATVASKHIQRDVSFPTEGHGALAWCAQFADALRPGQKLVVLTGENGHREWAESLRKKGVGVDFLPLYRRIHEKIRAPVETPCAVVATSGEALAALSACELSPQVMQTCLLLPAERLISVARQHGWSGRIASLLDLSPPAVVSALEECR